MTPADTLNRRTSSPDTGNPNPATRHGPAPTLPGGGRDALQGDGFPVTVNQRKAQT